MKTFIGIDLGTSGVKALLVDEKGNILKSASKSYDVYYPKDGYSEQNPKDWYEQSLNAIGDLLKENNPKDVKGISFGGQMHGLVMLDKNDEVIRNAILWNDGRSIKETDYLNNAIGKEKISEYTGNIAFAGFMAPKILWVYNNEKENFGKTVKIMLPKDYLIYKFSGAFATDVSDASGMLLLDCKNRKYSKEMLDLCHIKEEMLPKVYESYEVVGKLNKELEERFGMEDVSIIAGAGDNAAAAIGTGCVKGGDCNISLGTSGTIFICQDRFSVDEYNSLHSFCHANGRYHLMGCMLSAASAFRWFNEDILHVQVTKLQPEFDKYIGNNNVFFLPYLMGERSPHNDPLARGSFVGMRMDTTDAEMSLAVMEGVSFALRDSFEIAKKSGIEIKASKVCGGGTKSKVWLKVLSNILGVPLQIMKTEEGPSYGAAMLAMKGCGVYATLEEAADACLSVRETIYPDAELTEKYNKKYEIFRQIYPALKNIYRQI